MLEVYLINILNNMSVPNRYILHPYYESFDTLNSQGVALTLFRSVDVGYRRPLDTWNVIAENFFFNLWDFIFYFIAWRGKNLAFLMQSHKELMLFWFC